VADCDAATISRSTCCQVLGDTTTTGATSGARVDVAHPANTSITATISERRFKIAVS
jgi:hypothetical protein